MSDRATWQPRGIVCALVAACVVTWSVGCSRSRTPGPNGESVDCPIQLRDVTGQSGVRFVHTDGSSGQRYIMETVTGGVAIADFDGDGLNDIYFLNGAPLPGGDTSSRPRNALYRNNGDWTFTDITERAGVGDEGFGLGVAVADFDNDGDLDIYVNNHGPNVLYRNEGDGTFTDITLEAGVAAGDLMGAGASFLDVDGDGLLDLYVANYVDFTYDRHKTYSRHGYPEYAGPRDYRGVPDILYRNNGDGTFTDISQAAGIAQHAGTGMGIVAADYDADGDADMFVLNDVTQNFLFVNVGEGLFEERSVLAGFAYNGYGLELGSMGIDCGDYDNDGLLDFLMTSYQGELPVLYRNMGNGCFEDVTLTSGVGEGSAPHVNWGVGLVDFDNDGNRDAYIACGHLQDLVDKYDDSTSYEALNLLLMNLGNGRFANVTAVAGNGMAVKRSSRGAAFDDLDNDGNVDVVVLNSRRESTILRNESRTGHHWTRIRLRGVASNRDGVGAQVLVTTGDLTQLAEVHSGRGYQSHWGLALHFGLAKHERIDRIEVRWLGGGVDVVEDLMVDRMVMITQSGSAGSGPGVHYVPVP